MFLDYFALILLIFVAVILFYGVIAIHDIPYELAVKRNHPHQDAIHIAGWVSLFTLHVLWPFLWIWATLWREERGWGFVRIQEEQHDLQHRITLLTDRIAALEAKQVHRTNDGTSGPVPQDDPVGDSESSRGSGDAESGGKEN